MVSIHLCNLGASSTGNEPYGELIEAADHKAVGPPRYLLGDKGDLAGAIEQHGEHNARLDAGEGRPNTVVDAPSERHVTAQTLPLEIDLVRSLEHRRVAVGGAPEHHYAVAATQLLAAQRVIDHHGTPKRFDRRLIAQQFLEERRHERQITDDLTPDIVVTSNVGVTYSGSSKKQAEHGGFAHDDTNVIMLLSNPRLPAVTIGTPVQTTQVAPSILKALGLDPDALDSVRIEGTEVLPLIGSIFRDR